MRCTIVTIVITIALVSATSRNFLKIGAVLERDDQQDESRKSFEMAVQDINYIRNTDIVPTLKYVNRNDPFQAMTATCELIREGVVAILTLTSEDNSRTVQTVCDDMDIPQLSVRGSDDNIHSIVSVYPYQGVLTKVYMDIIGRWNIHDFVILYENDESLGRVSELLTINDYINDTSKIIVRQLDENFQGNYRITLKELWRSGARNFILDCSYEILEEVLKQAQQIGLLTNKESYIVTNLDFHTLDLESFQYSETNITGLRFIDPLTDQIQELATRLSLGEFWKVRLESALIMDAVKMFGEALKEVPKNFAPPEMDCDSDETWTFGSTLMNLMKGIKYPGLSGYVRFDKMGRRSDFGLEVIQLKEGGITQMGNWSYATGLNITWVPPPDLETTNEDTLANRSLVVLTCLTEPYGMEKETSTQLFGNDRYEGYAVDLIHELSQMLGFNYTLKIREDKKNGSPVIGPDGKEEWTGMIGDVIKGNADLAITDLTVTSDRERAVDFTNTFMTLGISILYQKPKKAPPSFFSFADPFAPEIWMVLACVFLGLSILLFILGRISPAEWQNPYPCIEEPEYLVNQLSFRNCLWFMTGSIMLQGSEIAPVAISTRMLAGMWWFLTLILSASYTANLAAFLSTESPDIAFNNVYELINVAEKKGITFGAKRGGATATFFNSSSKEEFQQIFRYMQEHDEAMIDENKEGVNRAATENYAFFMEDTSIEYETQRKCELAAVGGRLDEKGYGIAMRKNSTYRSLLTQAILKLQENGKLLELKKKWWEERRGGGQCLGDADSNEATPLNLKNVGGVFWVTIVGSFLSLVMMFIEMLTHLFKQSVRDKTSFKKLVVEELKFYFKFSGMVKPVYYTDERESDDKKDEDKSGNDNGKIGDGNNVRDAPPYGFIALQSKETLTDCV